MILATSIIAVPTLIKGLGLLWPVVASVIAIGASLFVATKVTDVKISNMKDDIEDLKEESKELRNNQLIAEKEIAKTLMNIEVKLGELTTIVKLFMEKQS
jgi:hypothetical protein